ncbi:hypothetical protein SK128_014717 [Halocaridina rubra]|uniref:Sulfotransferase domain-containing protein n=1 Tax=Halocaridina rubra TaxID=373956 RepID=A0AAN9A6H8_HALRR
MTLGNKRFVSNGCLANATCYQCYWRQIVLYISSRQTLILFVAQQLKGFFSVTGWANFTSERAHLWVKLYTAWLSLPRTKLHVVHYEHLQHNIEKEAKRLIQFLGLPLDYGRLECLIRYPEGHFRRPKYSKHLQGYQFPAASVNILKEGMRSIDSLLSQGRHPSLPKHLYSFTPRSIDRAIPRPNR